MKKVTVLVGENICDLQFQCGGRKEEGLCISESGAVKWIHHIDSSSRHLPENGKHPRVYQKYLEYEIDYILSYYNLILTTNSGNTIDIICNIIRKRKLHPEQLVVHGLSEDNKEIKFTCSLDKDKLCFDNWPYGFFDIVI